MDTYCWIHGTFSVPGAWSGQQGVEVPHPGVAPPSQEEEVVYHKYYQWVCYVLFLQVTTYNTCKLFYLKISGWSFLRATIPLEEHRRRSYEHADCGKEPEV